MPTRDASCLQYVTVGDRNWPSTTGFISFRHAGVLEHDTQIGAFVRALGWIECSPPSYGLGGVPGAKLETTG